METNYKNMHTLEQRDSSLKMVKSAFGAARCLIWVLVFSLLMSCAGGRNEAAVSAEVPASMAAEASAAPTFSPDEVAEILKPYLPGALACVLPCWLGVTPGQTDVGELHEIFGRFGANSFVIEAENVHQYSVAGSSTYFNAEDGVIVAYNTHILLNSQSPLLGAFLDFSAESLLRMYGFPDEVTIFRPRMIEPSEFAQYSVVSLYKSQGFLVIEEGVLIDVEDDFRCFSNQFAGRFQIVAAPPEELLRAKDDFLGELVSKPALDYVLYGAGGLALPELLALQGFVAKPFGCL